MAKTKEWKPKRVRSEDERGGQSDYIQLDEGEKFTGYALFAGDPAKDEPGYYEFLQHWVQAGKQSRSVPCAGDDCPWCEDGEKPRDVANTLWLVTKDQKGTMLGDDGEGELRIFKANSLVIKQFTEMRSEDEPILGRLFTVSRLDDRGNYMIAVKTKPGLKATKIKELVKSKDAPDFDQMVTSQLRKAMEGISIARALDDDDDDDPEDEPDEKKGKKKGAKEEKAKKSGKEDWPDELDGEEVEVESVEDEGNYFTAKSDSYKGTKDIYTTKGIEFDLTDLSEGDTVTVTTGEQDGDGDYILSADPEVEGGGGSNENEDIEDVTFTLAKVSKSKNSITVEDEDGDEMVLVGGEDDMFDDYTKGEVVVISAEWDDDDDEYKVSAIANAAAEGGDGADLPDKIEDEEFIVGEIDVKESTMEVKSEDLGLEFTLYFLDKGPASKVDFDDYEEGTKITLEAEKDSQGDMVATAIPVVVEDEEPAKKKGGKKKATAGKKGGKGK